jgi:hypothetical protein
MHRMNDMTVALISFTYTSLAYRQHCAADSSDGRVEVESSCEVSNGQVHRS